MSGSATLTLPESLTVIKTTWPHQVVISGPDDLNALLNWVNQPELQYKHSITPDATAVVALPANSMSDTSFTDTQTAPDYAISWPTDDGSGDTTWLLDTDDGMMTVPSYVSLESIQTTLAAHKLTLPWSLSPQRTLLSALGESPVLLNALSTKPIPYWVIGSHAVTGDGQVMQYGGRVVKNVTGYDMNRVWLGSHHQFATITSVTMRLMALPESNRSMLFYSASLADMLGLIKRLKQDLSTLESMVMFHTKQTFGWKLLVTLSGVETFVDTDAELAATLFRQLGLQTPEQEPLQQWRVQESELAILTHQLDWSLQPPSESLLMRAYASDGHLWSWLLQQAEVSATTPLAGFESPELCWVVGSNSVMLRWRALQWPDVTTLMTMQRSLEQVQGGLQLLHAPANLVHKLMAWVNHVHAVQSVFRQWWQRLKQAYDPNRVLWTPPTLGLMMGDWTPREGGAS